MSNTDQLNPTVLNDENWDKHTLGILSNVFSNIHSWSNQPSIVSIRPIIWVDPSDKNKLLIRPNITRTYIRNMTPTLKKESLITKSRAQSTYDLLNAHTILDTSDKKDYPNLYNFLLETQPKKFIPQNHKPGLENIYIQKNSINTNSPQIYPRQSINPDNGIMEVSYTGSLYSNDGEMLYSQIYVADISNLESIKTELSENFNNEILAQFRKTQEELNNKLKYCEETVNIRSLSVEEIKEKYDRLIPAFQIDELQKNALSASLFFNNRFFDTSKIDHVYFTNGRTFDETYEDVKNHLIELSNLEENKNINYSNINILFINNDPVISEHGLKLYEAEHRQVIYRNSENFDTPQLDQNSKKQITFSINSDPLINLINL